MAIDNTRSLGNGGLHSTPGKIVGREVRRYEFRSSSISDVRMQQIRNAVYTRMMSYPEEDLVNIITQYGDADQIKGNYSKENLAQITTEVLIINMDPNELKAIYDSVRVSQANLANDIHTIENKKPKGKLYTGRRRLSNNLADAKEKNREVDQKAVDKKINKIAKALKVHKAVRQGLPKLRAELNKVLREFTNIQIQSYAMRMDIDLVDGIPIKEVRAAIIDKVVTYALVVQNKLSVTFGTALGDTSVCEELLGYTTFYYLTGKTAITPGEWYQKQQAAKEAKALMDEKLRLAKKKRASKKAISNLTGGAKTANDIKAGLDTGPLANIDLQELIKIAGEYGIVVDKKSNPADIKIQVYKKMAIQNKRMAKLGKKSAKETGFADDNSMRLSVHGQIGALLGSGGSAVSGGGSTIPTISIGSDGVLSDSIDYAVPVYIVGQGSAGGQRGANTGKTLSRFNSSLGLVVGNNNVSGVTDIEDLNDFDKKLYYEIMTASVDRDSSGKIYRNTPLSIANAYQLKYKVSAKKLELIDNQIADPKWNALMKVAVALGRKQLVDYINYEVGSNIKSTSLKPRAFDAGAMTKVNMKQNKIFTNKENNGYPEDLVGKSADDWNVLKAADEQSLLSMIRKVGGNKIEANDSWPISALRYLAALALKDSELAQAIKNKFGSEWTGLDMAKSIKALRGKAKKATALNNMISAFTGQARMLNLAEPEVAAAPAPEASSETPATPVVKEKDTKGDTEKKSQASIRVLPGGSTVKNPMNATFKIKGKSAFPVYVINSSLSSISLGTQHMNETTENILTNVSNMNSTLKTLVDGLSMGIVSAAPMGVGTLQMPGLTAMNIITKASDAVKESVLSTMQELENQAQIDKYNLRRKLRYNTGAKYIEGPKISRFASGGSLTNMAITGDAAGSNMFKGGAKPELVQSNGDMSVTPLNRAGSGKQKVSRMTSTERANALATSISSHIVKFNYKLNGASEVSNSGEAIKVFNVKPGITDTIMAGGVETTLADLVSSIYAGITALVQNGITGNQLLSAIAAKPVGGSTVVEAASENPFPGLESSFDNILGGD